MSCNGCRILRKGCSENCILKQSLQGIECDKAQANATVFVAKFYGRAGLISFLSSVSESQRPALFQSLLYEACGRTVNPVTGAVGLLSAGNWHLCQTAAQTVLDGGVIALMKEFPVRALPLVEEHKDFNDSSSLELWDHRRNSGRLPARMTAGGRVKRRPSTPEESETTTLESCLEYNSQSLAGGRQEKPVLRLFL